MKLPPPTPPTPPVSVGPESSPEPEFSTGPESESSAGPEPEFSPEPESPAFPSGRMVAVLAGRPNVGKSALFNRLLGRRAALAHSAPGTTLDYLAEPAEVDDGLFITLADTGGALGESDRWTPAAFRQMQAAAARANFFLLVADARAGLLPADAEVAALLRKKFPDTPRILLANKAEGVSPAALALAPFYQLGIAETAAVSALRGDGVPALRRRLAKAARHFEKTAVPVSDKKTAPVLAIVGRPNVGKSTLLNRLTDSERAVVSEIPGTTRDSVSAEWRCAGRRLILADTGGLRRRRAESELEKMSEQATRVALRRADAALLLVDLSAGATRQDKRVAALIHDAGKPVVLGANKADLVPSRERAGRLARTAEDLPFVLAPPAFHFSALRGGPGKTGKGGGGGSGKRGGVGGTGRGGVGGGVGVPVLGMMDAVLRAAGMSARSFSTAKLNRVLSAIVARHPPPRAGGFRPKLRYAHQGGESPPLIVAHGGGAERIGEDYRRYLASALARELGLPGVPLRVAFRGEENPYA